MIQLTRRGTSITATRDDIDRAGARFERDCAVHLRGLLDAGVLAFVRRQIELDGFHEFVHDGLPSRPVDLAVNPGLASGLLALLTNDPRFLEFVTLVTRCSDIQSFTGDVHRRIPGAGHEGVWHSDRGDGNLAALTINLGATPFEGGVLQIRNEPDGPVVCEVKNDGPGDAILLKLGDNLKHRVTRPEGSVARTVWAGWFRAVAPRDCLRFPRGPK
jgi:hypothetical protein